jgi:hypothetical protein
MLGLTYIGDSAVTRNFLGGRMFAIYFRSAAPYNLIPHPRAWMYWTVNRDRRCLMPAINGRDDFAFHTQLASNQRPEDINRRRCEGNGRCFAIAASASSPFSASVIS